MARLSGLPCAALLVIFLPILMASAPNPPLLICEHVIVNKASENHDIELVRYS